MNQTEVEIVRRSLRKILNLCLIASSLVLGLELFNKYYAKSQIQTVQSIIEDKIGRWSIY